MTASRDTAVERRRAPSITLFFPVYRDERTVERVAQKALGVLAEITDDVRADHYRRRLARRRR